MDKPGRAPSISGVDMTTKRPERQTYKHTSTSIVNEGIEHSKRQTTPHEFRAHTVSYCNLCGRHVHDDAIHWF